MRIDGNQVATGESGVVRSHDGTGAATSRVVDGHDVGLYVDVQHLARRVSEYIADGMAAGDQLLIIARAAHWTAIAKQLANRGIDLVRARDAGRVIQLDAHDTLDAFMKDGVPDAALFERVVGSQVSACLNSTPSTSRLRAYGEMVDILWARGELTAARCLEEYWNGLQRRHRFMLLCTYGIDGFHRHPESVHDIVAAHHHVELIPPPSTGAARHEDADVDTRTAQLQAEIAAYQEIESSLRSTVSELRKQEEALRESEAHLRLVTDSLPVLVSFIDQQRCYRFVSAAYERWFGQKRELLVGRNMREVLGATAYEALEPHVNAALAGNPVTFESEVRYQDGGPRFIEATYIPKRSPNGDVTGFVALVADATRRRELERLRTTDALRSDRLVRVTAGIADAVTAPEVYAALVDRVVEAIGATSGGLWLVDESTAMVRLVRSRGYAEAVAAQLLELPLSADPQVPILDCIRREAPIWIESQSELFALYPRTRSLATPDQPYKIACLPLVAQGRVLGALGITITTEGSLTADERGFLMLISRYASQALERLRLLDSEKQSRATADAAARRASLLYGFAQAVSTASTLDDVYRAALQTIEDALGTERLAILTADEGGRPRFRAWRNLSDTYRRAVDGHSPWSPDATTFEPVLVSDALGDPSMAPFVNLFRQERIGALAFFPLVVSGKLLGKFMVYFDTPHAWLPHETEIASSIANHLASVITRFSAISRLEDTLRSNELFAAILAHDLRNPLGAIINSAQVVMMRQAQQKSDGDAANDQSLGRILRSGKRMTAMIDQLLDFARARSGGGIAIDPQNANLAELCAQAIAEVELVHPDWMIRLETAGNTGGVWDGARILQVISNLVSNAGQHGRAGGEIVVSVDGTNARELRVEVRNEGTIPEDLRAGLFEPFIGSRRANRLDGGGLGLGLFIVRESVRAHGGDVTVSCAGSDTVMSIRLPRVASGTTRQGAGRST